jgi:chromosome partitioning protein
MAPPVPRETPRVIFPHRRKPLSSRKPVSRIIAIANQKGGVGKTTTAINLGACLAVAEKRTLVIDIDPQANATSGLGVKKEQIGGSLYDVLVEGAALHDVVLSRVHFPYLDVAPATRDLVGVEVELVSRDRRETILRDALAPIRDDYDFILIDAPPSLGMLTLNTLAAADAVMIPIQSEFYALEGLSQLLNTVRIVQKNLNPGLQIEGVLLTMYDHRLNLSKQVAEEAKEYFGSKVYRTTIPRNVRLAEAPSFGEPIVLYDILSVGAKSYLALAQEVIARQRPGGQRGAPAMMAGWPGGEE